MFVSFPSLYAKRKVSSTSFKHGKLFRIAEFPTYSYLRSADKDSALLLDRKPSINWGKKEKFSDKKGAKYKANFDFSDNYMEHDPVWICVTERVWLENTFEKCVDYNVKKSPRYRYNDIWSNKKSAVFFMISHMHGT